MKKQHTGQWNKLAVAVLLSPYQVEGCFDAMES
jgi:hypothetical protein